MPKRHIVEEGEGISSIAAQYGFFPDDLWGHAANEALRRTRENPNALLAGDVLTIPDKRPRTVELATGARHQFRRKGVPALFSLQLFDGETPLANQEYHLTVDGETRRGVTDGQGCLQEYVPPDACEGRISVGKDGHCFRLAFGHMDPLSTLSGVQKRLNNLAFECGPPDGVLNEATQKALRRFQKRFGLAVTGEADSATLDKLEEMHDRPSRFPEGG